MATRSLLVCLAILLVGRQAGAFWWPFSGSEDHEEVGARTEAADVLPVPFEMRSAEQKFLSEAQKLLELTPLEACQHQVVSTLRRSCGELSEEELGKMSVSLLNCQSMAENRQTFPCTESMSLAECTTPMDATVWNAYHIISNRARSVCYATRQQQFRRQTEAVVNRLSSSTLEQIEAMAALNAQQSEVKVLAESSLSALNRYQEEAEEREEQLASRQEGMREKIANNLEQLTQEKVLIHSGQQLLANMTGDIRRQLEVASTLLGSQEESMKNGQKEIMEDITVVRDNIQQVWGRIDNSTSQLLTVLENISTHYESTLESLQVINETLTGVQEVVEGMRTAITDQLDWVASHLGGTNRGLRVLICCAGHTLFLLVATLCVVFLRAPGAARLFLLVSVIMNAVLDIRVGVALTYSALAALQIGAVMLNWFYLYIQRRKNQSSTGQHPLYIASNSLAPSSHPPSSHPPSSHLPTFTDDLPNQSSDDFFETTDITKPHRSSRNLTPLLRAASRGHTPLSRGHTPQPETLSSTPSKLAGSAPPQRCTGHTHSGTRCRLRAIPGTELCYRHEGQ